MYNIYKWWKKSKLLIKVKPNPFQKTMWKDLKDMTEENKSNQYLREHLDQQPVLNPKHLHGQQGLTRFTEKNWTK